MSGVTQFYPLIVEIRLSKSKYFLVSYFINSYKLLTDTLITCIIN